MSLDYILVYSATVFLASITPGPSMLLALNHGVRYGARRTIATAFGNVAATLIQALLSLWGLGTILFQSEAAFNVIKWLGAAYLVYVGVRMCLSSRSGLQLPAYRGQQQKSCLGLSLEAFVVTMGNPKAVLFFTALFPQFVNTRVSTAYQFFVIVALLLVTTFVCMMVYGFFGNRVAQGLRRPKVAKLYNRVIGGTFVGLGVGLAACRNE